MFAIFLLLSVLLVGGLALDLMRAETARFRMQETADRAVLAAASSTQERNEATVVADYFAKAGLTDTLGTTSVTPLTGGSEVNVTTSDSFSTSILGLAGITGWKATAEATAREAINKVEISLVLDVSGSMGDNNRLSNMKTAAKDFVNQVFSESNDDAVTVNVVPYSSQVRLPGDMADLYSIDVRHDEGYCVDFSADDFTDLGISTAQSLTQTGHFDPYTGYSYGMSPRSSVCPPNTRNEILPFSGNRSAINSMIDALSASGSTSIDVGMKWGAALLDPTARPVAQGLAGSTVDPLHADRPFSHDDRTTMKIVVLMTDGENTSQHALRPEYTSGRSDFWQDVSSGRLSLAERPPAYDWFKCSMSSYQGYTTGWGWGTRYCKTTSSTRYDDLYYAFHNGTWYDKPYGETGGIGIDGNDAILLTWDELWDISTVEYVAYMRYLASGNANDFYNNRYAPYRTFDHDEKNARLIDSCDAANAAGISVFTIAFEAPRNMVADPESNGTIPLLERCASHSSYAYDVEGLDISYAFNAVASSINTLRLTK